MRVFLTGATGFIGSRILPLLLAAGHEVTGLTRSDAGAAGLTAIGAKVYRGTLEDPASLQAGVAEADAVIHTAFDHNFSNFLANCEKERRVILAMGEALRDANCPLILTSGVGIGATVPGQPALETGFDPDHPNPRIATEKAGQVLLDMGLDIRVMRLPQVHDKTRQGLISPYIEMARENGFAAYVGAGDNRFSAAHVSDVVKLYVKALEHGERGARYNAVAEEGIAIRAIAETVAEGLGIPTKSLTADEAPSALGWMTVFASADMSASSELTRQWLNWDPTGPDLLSDLHAMDYKAVAV